MCIYEMELGVWCGLWFVVYVVFCLYGKIGSMFIWFVVLSVYVLGCEIFFVYV